MKRITMIGFVSLLLSGVVIHAQNSPGAKSAGAPVSSTSSTITITPDSTPVELARAALAAQGGEKFKNLQSMTLTGTVDITSSLIPQSIPGKFLWITSHERVRVELDARPFIVFKQIFDGERSYSSIPGLRLGGSPKSFGLPLLTKFDQPGYTVAALPNQKKLRGFRISDNEGRGTDFFIDPYTGRVVMYEFKSDKSSFSTEHSKMDMVDGVLVPYKLTQKFQTPQGVFYAEFKVKDAKVNEPLEPEVFAIPKP